MNQGKAALKLPGATARPAGLLPNSAQFGRSSAQRSDPAIALSFHEDLATAQADWQRFEQSADCTVFQSFGWLSAWQRHIGQPQGSRCLIVMGRSAGGELLFILPLALARRVGLRTLTWLGSDNNDYNAPLLAPGWLERASPQDFLVLWRGVLQSIQSEPRWRFDLIDFVRMPAQLGQQPNPFLGLSVQPHPDHAYLTSLRGPKPSGAPAAEWESFYASKRSSATRRRERTKRNRLSALGPLTFVTSTSPADMTRSMQDLFAQKTASFASMGARNIFARPGWSDFYQALAAEGVASGWAHVSRLDVGATPGAINLGLVFKGTYYHLLASHAGGEMARFSPGAAHLHDLMRYAIGRGCKVYDFTIGDESYKRDWSDSQAVLFDHVSAARVRGLPFAPLIRLQSRLKRFIKQTPAVWTAFTHCRSRLASLRAGVTSSPHQEQP